MLRIFLSTIFFLSSMGTSFAELSISAVSSKQQEKLYKVLLGDEDVLQLMREKIQKASRRKNFHGAGCSPTITDAQCLEGYLNLMEAMEKDEEVARSLVMVEINSKNEVYAPNTPELDYRMTSDEIIKFIKRQKVAVNEAFELEKHIAELKGIRSLWCAVGTSYDHCIEGYKKIGQLHFDTPIDEIRILEFERSEIGDIVGDITYSGGERRVTILFDYRTDLDNLPEDYKGYISK